MASVMPLARTPQDKKGASALRDYQRKLVRSLDEMAPWIGASRRLQSLRGKIKPGEVRVILGAGESADIPLFEDAQITKEK